MCMVYILIIVVWNETLIFLTFVTYKFAVLYNVFYYWKCMTYLVLFSHVNSCIIPLHGNDLKTAASHIENIFGDKKKFKHASGLCITLASLKIFKVFQTILLTSRLSLIFQLLSLSFKSSSFSACTSGLQGAPTCEK